jgi:hypothetical protein
MGIEGRRDGAGESLTIDRQGASCRHLIRVGRPHDERTEPAHFCMQQPDRVVLLVVGAERVRADQFGKR